MSFITYLLQGHTARQELTAPRITVRAAGRLPRTISRAAGPQAMLAAALAAGVPPWSRFRRFATASKNPSRAGTASSARCRLASTNTKHGLLRPPLSRGARLSIGGGGRRPRPESASPSDPAARCGARRRCTCRPKPGMHACMHACMYRTLRRTDSSNNCDNNNDNNDNNIIIIIAGFRGFWGLQLPQNPPRKRGNPPQCRPLPIFSRRRAGAPSRPGGRPALGASEWTRGFSPARLGARGGAGPAIAVCEAIRLLKRFEQDPLSLERMPTSSTSMSTQLLGFCVSSMPAWAAAALESAGRTAQRAIRVPQFKPEGTRPQMGCVAEIAFRASRDIGIYTRGDAGALPSCRRVEETSVAACVGVAASHFHIESKNWKARNGLSDEEGFDF